MKKILSLLFLAASLTACNAQNTTELHATANVKGVVYGDSIRNTNIMDLAAISTAMRNESKMNMTIRGKVNEVCAKKGCWLIMKLGNGEDMRVTFKDYKIFLPKDVTGKEVILDGFAYTDTTSVDKLRHYAEDAGKSAAEIAKITTPKKELAFEAKGVVVVE